MKTPPAPINQNWGPSVSFTQEAQQSTKTVHTQTPPKAVTYSSILQGEVQPSEEESSDQYAPMTVPRGRNGDKFTVDKISSTKDAADDVKVHKTESKAAPVFHLFASLPPELRLQIWKFAALEPHYHVIRLHQIPRTIVHDEHGNAYPVSSHAFSSFKSIPSTLLVNSESRSVCTRLRQPAFGTCTHSPKIRVNFATDSIMLESSGYPRMFENLFHVVQEKDLSQIRHLIARHSDFVDCPYSYWTWYIKKCKSIKAMWLYIGEEEIVDHGVNRGIEADVEQFFEQAARKVKKSMMRDQKKFAENEAKELNADQASLKWKPPKVDVRWANGMIRGRSIEEILAQECRGLILKPANAGNC